MPARSRPAHPSPEDLAFIAAHIDGRITLYRAHLAFWKQKPRLTPGQRELMRIAEMWLRAADENARVTQSLFQRFNLAA